jgi:hypothetical protein
MILRRNPHHVVPYDQSSSAFSVSEDEARVDFRDFGEGTERTSCLRIIATWDDVESLIASFAKDGHLAAVRYRERINWPRQSRHWSRIETA